MRRKEKINAPTTRYQGSKRRILPWLETIFSTLEFNTALDGFGGSGSVGYWLKSMGKEVTFNDLLKSNYQTGVALIENNNITLNESDINHIFNEQSSHNSNNTIATIYEDVYYLDKENRLLDNLIYNIETLSDMYSGAELKYKKALAYHILFQACLAKRPFNLFHRKNLNLRTKTVKRSFGNKKTWDKSFQEHFRNFNTEYAKFIKSNDKKNKAINQDIFSVTGKFDLVYLDPPYSRKHHNSPQNYAEMYHFLEGIMNYNNWEKNIDLTRVHKPFKCTKSNWNSDLTKNFDALFKKFSNSIIVVSYGNKGKPSIDTIVKLLKKYKKNVTTISHPYSYKLNRNNGIGYREVIIIGR